MMLNSNLDELDNNIGNLKHLPINRSATKTFSFKINPKSDTRAPFMMFGIINVIPLLATVVVDVTNKTVVYTSNPYGDNDLIVNGECTELDAEGYLTVTITFTHNIYGRIEILSRYSMMDNV